MRLFELGNTDFDTKSYKVFELGLQMPSDIVIRKDTLVQSLGQQYEPIGVIKPFGVATATDISTLGRMVYSSSPTVLMFTSGTSCKVVAAALMIKSFNEIFTPFALKSFLIALIASMLHSAVEYP